MAKKKPRGKPFQKGIPKVKNSGRKKGTPNKSTTLLKEAIANALSLTQDDLATWIKKAGKTSGLSGVSAFAMLAEFVQPKLARTEHSGPEGKPMELNVVTFDEATKQKLLTLGENETANNDEQKTDVGPDLGQ